MKNDSKTGFLRKALLLLTNNWGLKLLSLLLALIIYHSLKPSNGYPHTESDDRQHLYFRT